MPKTKSLQMSFLAIYDIKPLKNTLEMVMIRIAKHTGAPGPPREEKREEITREQKKQGSGFPRLPVPPGQQF